MTISKIPITNKKTYIYLSILAVIGFIIRFYRMPDTLFFGPEQGIDFLVIKEIVLNHKLTLIGAKTDVTGVFHGPLYYYLSSIPFLISKGNPVFISAFFIFISSLSIYLIYLAGKIAFNQRVGLIAATLMTFSPGVIIYSRWLSIHPLTIPLSIISLIFIIKFLKGDQKHIITSSVFLGLTSQAAFLNSLFCYAIIFVLLIYFRDKIKKTKKTYLLFSALLFLFISLGNFIFFDLRHDFLITKNIINLILTGSGGRIGFIKSTSEVIRIFLNQFSSLVLPNSFFISTIFLTLGASYLLIKSRSKSVNHILLTIWIFIPLLLLIALRQSALEQFFVIVAGSAILTVSILLDKILGLSIKSGLIIAILIILMNLNYLTENIILNNRMFFQSSQPNLKYIDQTKIINKIYEKSNNKSFEIQTFTIPFYMQEGWKYLFWYFGTTKFGYLPKEINGEKIFVIVQRSEDIEKEKYKNVWFKNEVTKWGNPKKIYSSGILDLFELMR